MGWRHKTEPRGNHQCWERGDAGPSLPPRLGPPLTLYALTLPCPSRFLLPVLLSHPQATMLRGVALASLPSAPWMVSSCWGRELGACGLRSGVLSHPGLPVPPPRPGTLKLMEDADKLLWSVQVDHQLFALEKLDVTVRGTFLPS